MEEPPPILEQKPEVPRLPAMSLAARFLNVFAVPGDVFEEIKTSRFSAANWLAPILLLAAVGALSAFVTFSQPAIKQQVRELQAKGMDKQVQAGKIKQEDADKVLAMIEKFTVPLAVVSVVAVSVARVFWWALVLRLLGLWFLKVPLGYLKSLEVAGLAMMINVLGSVVTLLLTVNLARLVATPSLALVINDFDATRKSHLMMGAVNVFSFWFIGVVSAGLARLAGVPFLKAAFLVFAYWLLQESLFILSGLGQFAL